MVWVRNSSGGLLHSRANVPFSDIFAPSFTAQAKSTPGFGIHPWFAHSVQDGWVERQRALLIAHPGSIVGEIGLDKAARTPETGKCE